MSFLTFIVLPTRLGTFLSDLSFPNGEVNPFLHLREQSPPAILFSELDLGKVGFGCPDGAIYVEHPGSTLLFIEVKLSETYEEGCSKKKYNSTIQGQLELKWRLTKLHGSKSHQLHNGKTYIIETSEFKGIYQDRDDFYTKVRSRRYKSEIGYRRHLGNLGIDQGVREFLQLLDKCDDRVYFCACTDDSTNPFDAVDPILLPRCGGQNWEESKGHFCWLPASLLRDARPATPATVTANG